MASDYINLPLSGGGGTVSQTEREKILSGSDLTKTITAWLDFGTSDERVSTVEITSTDVPASKIVRTLYYTGSPGSYVFNHLVEEVVAV